jgi:hypothetical protein
MESLQEEERISTAAASSFGKRSHSTMTEKERETDIVCYEKWPREKLDHIRSLLLPDELKNRLDEIRLEPGVERVKVRYSTCRGDAEGRVYGSIVYYSQWYKKQIAKRGETYDYMASYPREEEMDGGASLQRMDRWIRRLLAYENYHDYDIANCAPVLLQQIIEREGLVAPPELIAYNTERDTIFARYKGRIDLGVVKKAFLKVLHMGGEDQRIIETVRLKRALRATLLVLSQKDARYRDLYTRCRDECEKDSKKKKFSYLKDREEAKVTNSLGRFCAAVWQREEHTILMCMRAYFVSQGYHPQHIILCFDGIMVEKRESDATDVVDFIALSAFIRDNTGFSVVIEEKSLEPTPQDIAIYEGRQFFEKK